MPPRRRASTAPPVAGGPPVAPWTGDEESRDVSVEGIGSVHVHLERRGSSRVQDELEMDVEPSPQPKRQRSRRARALQQTATGFRQFLSTRSARAVRKNRRLTQAERIDRAVLCIIDALKGKRLRVHRLNQRALRVYHFQSSRSWQNLQLLAILALLLLLFWEPASSRSAADSEPAAVGAVRLASLWLMALDLGLISYHMGVRQFVRIPLHAVHVSVVLLSLLDSVVGATAHPGLLTRPLRPMLLVMYSPFLRRQLVAMLRTLPSVLDIGVFTIILLVVYAIAGAQLFEGLYPAGDPAEAYEDNFDTIHAALLACFVLLSTENYPQVMYPALEESYFAFWYFASFLICGVYVFSSVLIAMIFESYKLHHKASILDNHLEERTALTMAFRFCDLDNNGYITFDEWCMLLRRYFAKEAEVEEHDLLTQCRAAVVGVATYVRALAGRRRRARLERRSQQATLRGRGRCEPPPELPGALEVEALDDGDELAVVLDEALDTIVESTTSRRSSLITLKGQGPGPGGRGVSRQASQTLLQGHNLPPVALVAAVSRRLDNIVALKEDARPRVVQLREGRGVVAARAADKPARPSRRRSVTPAMTPPRFAPALSSVPSFSMGAAAEDAAPPPPPTAAKKTPSRRENPFARSRSAVEMELTPKQRMERRKAHNERLRARRQRRQRRIEGTATPKGATKVRRRDRRPAAEEEEEEEVKTVELRLEQELRRAVEPFTQPPVRPKQPQPQPRPRAPPQRPLSIATTVAALSEQRLLPVDRIPSWQKGLSSRNSSASGTPRSSILQRRSLTGASGGSDSDGSTPRTPHTPRSARGSLTSPSLPAEVLLSSNRQAVLGRAQPEVEVVEREGAQAHADWLDVAKMRVLFDEVDMDRSNTIDLDEFQYLLNVLLLDVQVHVDKPGYPGSRLRRALRRLAPLAAWQHPRLERLVHRAAFEYTVLSVITANLLAAIISSSADGPPTELEWAFTGFFLVEVLVKVGGLSLAVYWRSLWNRFDFGLILLSLLTQVVLQMSAVSTLRVFRVGRFVRFVRFVRAFRGLRVIAVTSRLRSLANTLLTVIPVLGAQAAILSLVFYVYAAVGMELLAGRLDRWQETRDSHAHFDDPRNAFIALFQIFTTSNWHEIMYAAMAQGKSRYLAWFFVTFYFTVVIFVGTLLTALVLETYFVQRQYQYEGARWVSQAEDDEADDDGGTEQEEQSGVELVEQRALRRRPSAEEFLAAAYPQQSYDSTSATTSASASPVRRASPPPKRRSGTPPKRRSGTPPKRRSGTPPKRRSGTPPPVASPRASPVPARLFAGEAEVEEAREQERPDSVRLQIKERKPRLASARAHRWEIDMYSGGGAMDPADQGLASLHRGTSLRVDAVVPPMSAPTRLRSLSTG